MTMPPRWPTGFPERDWWWKTNPVPWLAGGGAREPTTPMGPTALAPGATHMSYEEFLALTPEEQQMIVSGGNQPTIVLPEGWKWEQKFDPKTGSTWQVSEIEEDDGDEDYKDPSDILAREDLEFRIRKWEADMARAAETGDMTAYQQAQLELQQAQLGLQERQWQAGLQASPRNWIERWYAGQTPRAAEGGQRTRFADMTSIQRGADIMGGRRQGQQPIDLAFRPIYGRDYTTAQEYAEVKQRFDKLRQATEQAVTGGRELDIPYPIVTPGSVEEAGAIRRELRKSDRGKRQPKRPTAPNAPEWLLEFAPWLVAGQPITRGTQRWRGGKRGGAKQPSVKTPSGQLWGRTPWSQREGLAGFADWMGGRPIRDIMDEMAMMQPVRPEQRVRWKPARR